MLPVTINGRRVEARDGATILDACRDAGINIPTLCHDSRLHPIGACRLCVVEITGQTHYASACSTRVSGNMEIQTHSPGVEKARRQILRLLARHYPKQAIAAAPDKPFHRLLTGMNLVAGEPESGDWRGGGPSAAALSRPVFRDSSHPYIDVDMSRCVLCFRCVRACEELQGLTVWRAWHRAAMTRIRPGTAATLRESACVSCGACVDTCPTGALEDKTIAHSGGPTRWTRTVCPYCGVGCEMLAGTRSGRIVQIKPPLDAAVNRGHLCVKGRYAFRFVSAHDRIVDPMIREEGSWRKASWAEAVTHVANTFERIVDESGPDAIGVLGSARSTNEENYLTQKFARVVLGTNNIDCCARVCHAPSAAALSDMLGTGAATNSFDDIERAATILVAGCNPTENHPVVGARIGQAVRRGARLIVIDPRAIELARSASIHLRLRPGTDVALLNALAHVVIAEGRVDEAMARERLEGLETFRDFILPWTPERAAAICDVAAGEIRAAARLLATHQPAMTFHGLGVTEHVQGTDAVKCLVNLALLTGNVGKPGTGVNPLRGQNNVQGAAHMGCEPRHLPGAAPIDAARERFEAAWDTPLPHSRGLDLPGMIAAAGAGNLKALWAIGYDIALTNPRMAATNEALAKLDLLVVQDLFLNETARQFAHVFLPACSSFEKDGTFMNAERRVQRVRRVIEPITGSQPDWKIICQVARSMGFQDHFNFDSAEEIWDEIRALWPAGAGMTYRRLAEAGLQWPCPGEGHPGTAVLHQAAFTRGPRAPLECIDLTLPDDPATDGFPFVLMTGRTLYQFNAGTMSMRTPNAELRATDTLDVAVEDAAHLGLREHEQVRVRSRFGETVLPVHIDPAVHPGQLFATFHTPGARVNQLTGSQADRVTHTPEYKRTLVRIEKL